MKKILLFAISFFFSAISSSGQDEISYKTFNINAGASIGPQMLFVGALDMGIYTNVEYHPFSNFSFIGGGDIRNRWITLSIVENAGTSDLKTHYSIIGAAYLGAGYTYRKGSEKRNSFYIAANPYLFNYKESVSNSYFNNTIFRNTDGIDFGIIWSSTQITKKGRRINTQLYVPVVFGIDILDHLRFMSFRIGLEIGVIGNR